MTNRRSEDTFTTAATTLISAPQYRHSRGSTSYAVLLALYPTVMLLSRFLSPRLETLHLTVSTFLGAAPSVALLSWLLMPLANRLLGPWLTERSSRVTRLGTIAVLALYGLMIVLFFRW